MNIRRLIWSLLLLGCMGVLSVHADEAEQLRQKLPKLKGDDRIAARQSLYQLSLSEDDVEYQTRCLHDLVEETRLQKNHAKEAIAINIREVYFYNNDMSDSVYRYVPEDLKVLRNYRFWNKYYEAWTLLINTYLYCSNSNQTALREVQAMFDDAVSRNDKYGMGMAYYTMGNVYVNMNNLDESANSYQKGLQILSDIKPQPNVLADIYSYFGDVLNEKHQYEELKKLTERWKSFLEPFIKEKEFSQRSADVLWSYYYIACAQASLGLHQLDSAAVAVHEVQARMGSEETLIGTAWLFYQAELFLQQGKLQEALELNTRRLKRLDEGERSDIITTSKQRAEILKRLGRFAEAAEMYQEMYQMADSINAQDTRNQLNEMNTLFQVDELKMEQERAQFRNTLIIIGLIVLALAVFTIFRIRAARRLKKAHDELLVAYDQLEETTTAKERIESDLRIARNIQMGMVPSTFPQRPDLDLFASMTPAKEVGGDLYGYLLVEGNGDDVSDKLYFALGDVSGKGVPASLFMAQATRLFRTLAAQGMMPAEIATRMNDALSGEDNETGMFVTMFIGLVDLKTGHLDFSNAGHNPPVLLRDGQPQFIEMEPNAPIGLWPGLEYVGESIDDISNCPLFVYTDGLNEAENRQQEQFTDERLLEILGQTTFESSQQTIGMLREAVEQHRDGAEPNDDLTMLCVKVVPQSN